MASKKVKLPSGNTVTLRDPKTIKVGDRKKIFTASDNVKGGEMSKALATGDAIIAIMVEEWSFDLIIPSVKASSLDELSIADYDFLVEQSKELQKVLFPSLAETEETATDPDSPFDDSNDSNG